MVIRVSHLPHTALRPQEQQKETLEGTHHIDEVLEGDGGGGGREGLGCQLLPLVQVHCRHELRVDQGVSEVWPRNLAKPLQVKLRKRRRRRTTRRRTRRRTRTRTRRVRKERYVSESCGCNK